MLFLSPPFYLYVPNYHGPSILVSSFWQYFILSFTFLHFSICISLFIDFIYFILCYYLKPITNYRCLVPFSPYSNCPIKNFILSSLYNASKFIFGLFNVQIIFKNFDIKIFDFSDSLVLQESE